MADEELEVVLVLQSDDQSVAEELAELLEDPDDVSVAKRAIGGVEIKAFFLLISGVLGKILGFVSKNRDRLQSGEIIVGTERISLKGYGPDDVLKLLESEQVKKAIDSYRGK